MKKIGLIIISIILLLLFLSIFFSVSFISGAAMEPAVKNGQNVVYRTSYPSMNLQRSDIVFYTDPNRPDVDHIGRIVGMPSESIRIGKGNVYIDDNQRKYKIIEDYLPIDTKTRAQLEDQWFKLSQYEYFIIKDNREAYTVDFKNSIVHKNNIKGKLLFKL